MNKDKNEITVLGAYGTKAKEYGTSSFYLNAQNMIDAGNLLNTLGEDCALIDNIWITHSHLDHIVDIAYILDNYFSLRKRPLNIIGLPKTIEAIKQHYLNNIIWPDFSQIPLIDSQQMAVKYTEIELHKSYHISNTEKIRAFKTNHTVESCGFVYTKNKSSVLITADTYTLDTAIEEILQDKSIKTIIVECSFPSSMNKLAKESKHLTPKLLFKELEKLKTNKISLYINHIKIAYLEKIKAEIDEIRGNWTPKLLKDGEFVKF
jgi:ribonuclease BN (tRNA processing enzyme)